ncbi:hypothetical protein [Methanogenium cariaci]|uniref:hypothetical protein n=1 Tax=Methanogenium cariaci TaxID=2197 RepID=UPI001FDF04FF|nr:hypothetical protein [Methanogenium cariaci]
MLSELFDDRYDIQIFGNLPLYVRMEVLRGGVSSTVLMNGSSMIWHLKRYGSLMRSNTGCMIISARRRSYEQVHTEHGHPHQTPGDDREH